MDHANGVSKISVGRPRCERFPTAIWLFALSGRRATTGLRHLDWMAREQTADFSTLSAGILAGCRISCFSGMLGN